MAAWPWETLIIIGRSRLLKKGQNIARSSNRKTGKIGRKASKIRREASPRATGAGAGCRKTTRYHLVSSVTSPDPGRPIRHPPILLSIPPPLVGHDPLWRRRCEQRRRGYKRATLSSLKPSSVQRVRRTQRCDTPQKGARPWKGASSPNRNAAIIVPCDTGRLPSTRNRRSVLRPPFQLQINHPLSLITPHSSYGRQRRRCPADPGLRSQLGPVIAVRATILPLGPNDFVIKVAVLILGMGIGLGRRA